MSTKIGCTKSLALKHRTPCGRHLVQVDHVEWQASKRILYQPLDAVTQLLGAVEDQNIDIRMEAMIASGQGPDQPCLYAKTTESAQSLCGCPPGFRRPHLCPRRQEFVEGGHRE